MSTDPQVRPPASCWGALTGQMGALGVDLWPQRVLATVFGLIAVGSGFGGLLSSDVIGRLLTTYSYTPVFALLALLHPCAYVLLRRAVRR